MNSVTGLEFSYTQAPKSMKSVVQSFWLLTTFFGNIFDIFFVEIKIAPTQVKAKQIFIIVIITIILWTNNLVTRSGRNLLIIFFLFFIGFCFNDFNGHTGLLELRNKNHMPTPVFSQ